LREKDVLAEDLPPDEAARSPSIIQEADRARETAMLHDPPPWASLIAMNGEVSSQWF
jgi:hypothetical protein